jgi:hypothetical protein
MKLKAHELICEHCGVKLVFHPHELLEVWGKSSCGACGGDIDPMRTPGKLSHNTYFIYREQAESEEKKKGGEG